MKWNELNDIASAILERAGFDLIRIHDLHKVVFDIIARRDDLLIIVKIVKNIDSISKHVCNELKIISKQLDASVFIVGDKGSSSNLDPGIVYFRYNIPIISWETLKDLFIHDIKPFSHSAHGGFYVSMDGTLLQKIRTTRRIPLSALAECAGVSKRSIQMYENGMDVSVDVALRIEDFLGVPVIKSSEFLSIEFHNLPETAFDLSKFDLTRCDPFEKEVLEALNRIGTHVIPIFKCPFNAFTGDHDSLIITGISELNPKVRKRIGVISRISRISSRRSMFVVDRVRSKKNVEGTPLVGKKELSDLQNPDDIDQLLEKRKGKES